MRNRIREFRQVRAGELRAARHNPAVHTAEQRAAVGDLLERFGLVDVLLAWQSPRGLELIDGHLRAELAADQEVSVAVLDVADQAEADALLAALDASGRMAEVDGGALGELLRSAAGALPDTMAAYLGDLAFDSGGPGLESLGLPATQLATQLATQPATQPEAAADDAAEAEAKPDKPKPPRWKFAADLRRKWGTQPGQVWEVTGRATHRLAIVDCRDAAAVSRLFGGPMSGHLVVTDPPYVQRDQRASRRTDADEMPPVDSATLNLADGASLAATVAAAFAAAGEPAAWYVFAAWRSWADLLAGLPAAPRSAICWNKQAAGTGGLWREQFELIAYGAAEGCNRPPGVANGNVLAAKRTGNRWHVTEKPVGLLRRLIEADQASGRRGAVYDPFAGGGATLLAAESLERPSFGCEIEPTWAAVILERLASGGGASVRQVG